MTRSIHYVFPESYVRDRDCPCGFDLDRDRDRNRSGAAMHWIARATTVTCPSCLRYLKSRSLT